MVPRGPGLAKAAIWAAWQVGVLAGCLESIAQVKGEAVSLLRPELECRPGQHSGQRGAHGRDFAGEESSAKYVQQAVNALQKAEMRVARIGKSRRRRRLGLWRMRRRFKLHTQKRNADSTLLKRNWWQSWEMPSSKRRPQKKQWQGPSRFLPAWPWMFRRRSSPSIPSVTADIVFPEPARAADHTWIYVGPED